MSQMSIGHLYQRGGHGILASMAAPVEFKAQSRGQDVEAIGRTKESEVEHVLNQSQIEQMREIRCVPVRVVNARDVHHLPGPENDRSGESTFGYRRETQGPFASVNENSGLGRREVTKQPREHL